MLLKRMLEILGCRHYNNGFRIRTTDRFLCRRQLNFRLKKKANSFTRRRLELLASPKGLRFKQLFLSFTSYFSFTFGILSTRLSFTVKYSLNLYQFNYTLPSNYTKKKSEKNAFEIKKEREAT
jgi:hypothetical protein